MLLEIDESYGLTSDERSKITWLKEVEYGNHYSCSDSCFCCHWFSNWLLCHFFEDEVYKEAAELTLLNAEQKQVMFVVVLKIKLKLFYKQQNVIVKL